MTPPETRAEAAVAGVKQCLAQLRDTKAHSDELNATLTVRLRVARAVGVPMPELAELTGLSREYLYRRLRP